jgi:hypothetical protein
MLFKPQDMANRILVELDACILKFLCLDIDCLLDSIENKQCYDTERHSREGDPDVPIFKTEHKASYESPK